MSTFPQHYHGMIILTLSSEEQIKCLALFIEGALMNVNQLNQLTLLTLYKSLVRPQLAHASQVCSPYTKGKIMAIDRVQRRATKVILSVIFQ